MVPVFRHQMLFKKKNDFAWKKCKKLHVYRLLKKAQISKFCENNQFLYKNMVKNDGSWYENRKNNNNIAIKEVGVVKVTKKKQNNPQNGWNKIRSALSD